MELYGIEKEFTKAHASEKLRTVYILEDQDCSHVVFEDCIDALKFAEELIDKDTYMTDEVKMKCYKELLDSFIIRKGQGFVVDEYLWCYDSTYYGGKGNENGVN